MNAKSLPAWVDTLQQSGRYSFLRQEAIDASGLSSEAVKKSLQRLAKRKRIAKVSAAFYVIVPTEYISAGTPPTSWFIHHFMETRKQPYYVALLSAASLHGASHHPPQEFQVVTRAAIRPIRIARQRIRFFIKQAVVATPIVQIKTPTGMIRVSTPAATMLDLVRFSRAAGHLDNIATLLHELAEKVTSDDMAAALARYDGVPTVQRLGYLLETLGADTLAAPLADWLAHHRTRAVPLRSGHSSVAAPRNSRWNILINASVEAEI